MMEEKKYEIRINLLLSNSNSLICKSDEFEKLISGGTEPFGQLYGADKNREFLKETLRDLKYFPKHCLEVSGSIVIELTVPPYEGLVLSLQGIKIQLVNVVLEYGSLEFNSDCRVLDLDQIFNDVDTANEKKRLVEYISSCESFVRQFNDLSVRFKRISCRVSFFKIADHIRELNLVSYEKRDGQLVMVKKKVEETSAGKLQNFNLKLMKPTESELNNTSHLNLISTTKLIYSSPEYIYEYLTDKKNIDKMLFSEAIVKELLARDNKLIDLAIIQVVDKIEIIREILEKYKSNTNFLSALRLAAFSNSNLDRFSFGPSKFPFTLYDADKSPEFVKSLTKAELTTILLNNNSDAFTFYDVCTGAGEWSVLDSKLRQLALYIFSRSNCFNVTSYQLDFAYGDEAHYHDKPYGLFWKLAESLPVDKNWARALADLYSKLTYNFFGSGLEDILNVAKRWDFDSSDLDGKAAEARSNLNYGSLSEYQALRKQLARVEMYQSKIDLTVEFLASADLAIRCAAYSFAILDAKQIVDGAIKDGKMALKSYFDNLNIWANYELREALSQICSEKDQRETFSSYHHEFRERRNEIKKIYPSFFIDGN